MKIDEPSEKKKQTFYILIYKHESLFSVSSSVRQTLRRVSIIHPVRYTHAHTYTQHMYLEEISRKKSVIVDRTVTRGGYIYGRTARNESSREGLTREPYTFRDRHTHIINPDGNKKICRCISSALSRLLVISIYNYS